MSSLHDLMDADERLVYRTRTSWVAPFLTTPVGSLLVLGGLVSMSLKPVVDWGLARLVAHPPPLPEWLGILATLAGLLAVTFGAMFVGQAFTERWLRECVVTDRRLLLVDWRARNGSGGFTDGSGGFTDGSGGGTDEAGGTTSIWLHTMTEVTMEQQDLLGIWLGFATIRVTCEPGEGLVLERMGRPADLLRVIQQQRRSQA